MKISLTALGCVALVACAVRTCAADGAGWSVQSVPPPTVASGQIADLSCVSRTACVAVGSFKDSGGGTATLAERWDGRSWSLQRTPNPRSGDGGLSAVSCTSSSACTAVGSNVVERWNGRSWSIQQVRSDVSFSGVSCWSLHGCTAVGENYNNDNGNYGTPFAERWAGRRWRSQPVPDAGGEEDGFASVSCASASACIAVGFVVADSSGDTVNLAERWDGRRWSFAGGLDPGFSDQFYDVSCVSASNCTAVGSFFNLIGTERPMVERWNGRRWSFDVSARPAQASTGRLVAVSCRSARVCTAVGSYQRGAAPPHALIERSRGSKWSVRRLPAGADHAIGALSSISCTSANACTSIGSTQAGAGILAEQWGDQGWASRAVPDPTGPLGSTLNGVSCTSTTACIAVGSFQASQNAPPMPLVEAWNGVRWAVEVAPSPAGAGSGQLNAVSCASASECTAVGSFTASGNGQPTELIEVLTGGAWKIEPAPETADSTLNGVSCAAAGACVAVGSAANTNGFQMLAEAQSGSRWTVASTPQPSGASDSRLNAVSCTSATVCTAAGYMTDLDSGSNAPLAEAWNGASWMLQTTSNPTADADDQFTAISCPASIACAAVGTSSDQTTLAERWDGSSWTAESSPNPGGASTSVLNGVSCGSPDACMAVGVAERDGSLGQVASVLTEQRTAGNWAIVGSPSPSGGKLNQVSCVSAAVCTAVGSFTTAAGLQMPLVERFSQPDRDR